MFAANITATGERVIADETSRESGPFVCGCCGEPVTYRRGPIVSAHFAHRPESTCAIGGEGESAEHERSKLTVFRGLRARGVECDIERRVGNRIADVLAVINGQRVAIEVQYSRIPAELIAQRTADYAREGVAVIWLFGGLWEGLALKDKVSPPPMVEWMLRATHSEVRQGFRRESGGGDGAYICTVIRRDITYKSAPVVHLVDDAAFPLVRTVALLGNGYALDVVGVGHYSIIDDMSAASPLARGADLPARVLWSTADLAPDACEINRRLAAARVSRMRFRVRLVVQEMIKRERAERTARADRERADRERADRAARADRERAELAELADRVRAERANLERLERLERLDRIRRWIGGAIEARHVEDLRQGVAADAAMRAITDQAMFECTFERAFDNRFPRVPTFESQVGFGFRKRPFGEWPTEDLRRLDLF